MEGLYVFEKMTIQSKSGPYNVSFELENLDNIFDKQEGGTHFLVDSNVAKIYKKSLSSILQNSNTLIVKAVEENKSIEKIIPLIENLVKNRVRRNHVLIAIGGGIVQDITCFIASTLLRGLEWRFVPTTLLAQADSCIGSKSSINLGSFKNILGTFNPPKHIWIFPNFLKTLDKKDLQSGIGEIIKVHAIQGIEAFNQIKEDFDNLILDHELLLVYIQKALKIKKHYIEIDEHDKGIRNIFNYGHSFGHAIESATEFAIPHGVAVSIGMDMANHISVMHGLLPEELCKNMHYVLRKNYEDFKNVSIPTEKLLMALRKDKKNTDKELTLILPIGEIAEIKKVTVPPDETFRNQCDHFIKRMS